MTARRPALLAAALLLLLASGCGPEPLRLGSNPDLLWWTDHESGDLADWQQGGELRGGAFTQGTGSIQVVAAPDARSGRYLLRSTVTGSTAGTMVSGAADRLGTFADPAYYSAWFRLAAAARPDGFWVIFKFRARTVATDYLSAVDLWDVDLAPGDGGSGMALRLFNHNDNGLEPALGPAPVPVGRWFQIEALFRPAPDATGRLSVWLDGALVFDVRDRATAPASFVEWSVGSITQALTPPLATLDVDDAAISRTRLGPDFPVFSR